MQLISVVLATLLVPQILGCRWTFQDSCYDYVSDGANFWVSQAYCQENFNGNLVTKTILIFVNNHFSWIGDSE